MNGDWALEYKTLCSAALVQPAGSLLAISDVHLWLYSASSRKMCPNAVMHNASGVKLSLFKGYSAGVF